MQYVDKEPMVSAQLFLAVAELDQSGLAHTPGREEQQIVAAGDRLYEPGGFLAAVAEILRLYAA